MPQASPPARTAGRDAAMVLGALLLLGAVCGVVWWLVVDPAEFVKTSRGGAMGEDQLGKRFNADAWFLLIALVAGVAAGLALSAWRSRDPLLTSGLLVAGSAVAAAAMALVGHLLGPHGTEAALRAASVGAHVPEPLSVDVFLVYLAWPVGALAGDLFVLLGRAPEDRGGHPGEGTAGAPEPATPTPVDL
jgi:hypothetical protein